jgi:hypothetical protein
MFRSAKAGLFSVIAAALLAGCSAAAASTPPKAADPMPAGTRILVDGHSVTLPKPWDRLTIPDLAKLGIHPGTGAQDYPPPSTSGSGLPAGTRITLPDGRHVALPKPWAQMTMADLAKIGIHPDMGPKIEDAFLGAKPARPDTASRCQQEVCIYIRGSGLTVNSWETTGDYDGPTPVCTYSVYWAPANTIYATGAAVCGGEGLYVGYDKDTPIIWGSPVTVCNTWTEMFGKPCVGVE